jgi:hypothetical protein
MLQALNNSMGNIFRRFLLSYSNACAIRTAGGQDQTAIEFITP